MLPQVFRKTIQLPDGREIVIETGKLARQADGAVVVSMGSTMLLATVVSVNDAKEGVDFLPLSVDYQEKFASSGKIPGGFLKREGKLSDYEVLISRLVDRAIRPMFPDDYHAETQINIFLISADLQTPPDALAGLAASAAIAVSDIPLEDYISEVRVARVNGQLLINPTATQLAEADIELMVGASYDNILMVEGEMKEVSEEEMLEAIKYAHETIKMQCIAQKELAQAVGKTEKRVYSHENNDEALYARMESELFQPLYEVAKSAIANKNLRSESFKAIKEGFVERLKAGLGEGEEINKYLVEQYFSKLKKKACRKATLQEKHRLDGRQYNEIRPIWCEAGLLPSPHGSALFTRGETQSLTTVTLGTKMDEQMIDGAMNSGYNKFILHYNFPSFSTGEVKPNRAPGRREIGHGNLAYRALKVVIPPLDENPYTIRVVSDILESNGSSSMATVCAGTLALMDAGVKIKAPVAGIAMGLISDSETGDYAVLSDILGDEDHLGDMDFKVTGTAKGITATQMDMKVYGLSYDVLSKALHQAREGRLHILGKMLEVLAETRPELKPHAPRIEVIKIPQDMIGAVIGPGGKVVQEIQKDSGAVISIEERDGAGYVNIFATNGEAMQKAAKRVKGIVAVPEVGQIYEGKVRSIMPFGAFVEFMPGKDGLLHISEVKWERLESLEGVLEVGEEITVKLLDVDKKTGKFKLSRKVLLPKPEFKGDNKPKK
ncbi:MAG: polyribonucleotide nucleotidyltransferase [Microscillaceae bacterium]|jgi:polyribonucleotide nucleotidyltransferase|nr:polyribonucleotide nucleotidyltransferase [Microscillaceae bacterium]